MSNVSLYHFTDSRNVESIKKHGLLSWPILLERGIQHFPGSDEDSRDHDRRKKLHYYVRLARTREHRMAYVAVNERRIHELVWLEIDDMVTRWRATLFSDRNATANEAVIDEERATAFSSQDTQAEVLIKESLNPKWITFP